MIVENSQRLAFLQNIHVFHDLREEDIAGIAHVMREVHLSEGKNVFKQGQPADAFYIIFSGKIMIVRQEKDQEHRLAVLVKGDYFGEGSMKKAETTRNATARAVGDTVLLVLSRDELHRILDQNQIFRKKLEVSVECRRLAHKLRFKWVRDDEVVHFVVRKHWLILLARLIIPLLIALLGIVFIAGLTDQAVFIWLGGLLLLVSLAWAVWQWVDWGNDYYIVTNQRVVWLEKVVALYDSSVESPLSAIRTENVETGLIGRMLDFGDLVVYTYIGRIVFHNIPHPYEARVFVDEQRARVKEIMRADEVKDMKSAIRSRLFPEEEMAIVPEPDVSTPTRSSSVTPKLRKGVGGLFSLRFEDKETITYRKHTFVLIKQAGLPVLVCILLIAIFGIWLGSWLNSIRDPLMDSFFPVGLFLLWLAAFLGFAGWSVYQYVDWRNDIFQVSYDQILDIDKKPLGREERKSAPLENILSTEYKRIGILQLLFNYGTVYIVIGREESMAFEDVMDPASVQQDIDRRRLASITKKEEQQVASDRDRLADFFADFYRSSDEYHHTNDDGAGDNEVQ